MLNTKNTSDHLFPPKNHFLISSNESILEMHLVLCQYIESKLTTFTDSHKEMYRQRIYGLSMLIIALHRECFKICYMLNIRITTTTLPLNSGHIQH